MTDPRFRSQAGAAEIHGSYQELVHKHLPSVQRQTIATPIGPVTTITGGLSAGPPVVLLHGSGATALSWTATFLRLTETYRVHLIDLPGEPGLSTATRVPFTTRDQADWLAVIHRELVGTPAAYVGVSIGGWIATAFAIEHPESVSHLVLQSSSGFGPRKMGPLLIAGTLSALGEPGRRRALSYLTGPHVNRAPRTDIQRDLDAFALRTFAHFKPRTDALPEHSAESVSSIRPRVTAIFGAQDRMLDAPAAAGRIRDLLPAANVELRPHAGHVLGDPATLTLDQLRGPSPLDVDR